MKELSLETSQNLRGGSTTSGNQCAYQIASSALVGGLFGGAGAVIGAIAAATGPGCLSLW